MINNNHKSCCYFPDGVNVGAFAKLTLIIEYKKGKKTNDAEKEIEILKREYQHSIDHQETLLTDRLEELINIFRILRSVKLDRSRNSEMDSLVFHLSTT